MPVIVGGPPTQFYVPAVGLYKLERWNTTFPVPGTSVTHSETITGFVSLGELRDYGIVSATIQLPSGEVYAVPSPNYNPHTLVTSWIEADSATAFVYFKMANPSGANLPAGNYTLYCNIWRPE